MGAKRAVAGRSQPYDVLLAAYQKKAIGRPQGKITKAIGFESHLLHIKSNFSISPSLFLV
jgi:hypothetical protein